LSADSCGACLRRAWLLEALAPYIERVATGKPGSRAPELLRLPDERLAAAVAGKSAERILAAVHELSERELRARLEAADCWAVCRHDRRYPQALRGLADAPAALLGTGQSAPLERLEMDRTVTVVGARRAGAYGVEVARSLGRGLAAAGFTVVSGMALGVDGAAHRGALEAGETLAVLGCGPDVAYPALHRGLHRQIRNRTAVIAELPPGSGPWRWMFPARNRIMAGLGAMTVVVVAAEQSGSLITADIASELGREVGAVPGPVNSVQSEGANKLLADGAHLVRDAQDVLDALLGPGVRTLRATGPPLDPDLLPLLDAIEGELTDHDSIALELGRDGASVAAALARLELLGYVRGSLSGRYARTGLERP
jgi:DNA processing protein